MEDLRREKALIKNPALATAKKNKAARELSTDAARKEQTKRNKQASQTKATQNKNTISTPTPKPSTPKPSTPKVTGSNVKGIIPTTSNSITQPVTQPVEPEKSAQDMINEMIESQRKARIAELDKARDAALRSLEGEETQIKSAYYDARNRAAAQSDIGALNFAQYMASRGITGGAAGMPEIYRQAALQGELGALNRQEQAALDAIERDRTGVLSAYEQDRLAILSDLDARALQAQIEQMNLDRQFGLQEAGVTGEYKGQPTLQKLMWESDVAYRNKQLQIDAAYKQGTISAQQAQAALAQAKFDHEVEMDYINSLFRAKELESAGSLSAKEKANIMAQIDQMPLDSERKRELAKAYGILP